MSHLTLIYPVSNDNCCSNIYALPAHSTYLSLTHVDAGIKCWKVTLVTVKWYLNYFSADSCRRHSSAPRSASVFFWYFALSLSLDSCVRVIGCTLKVHLPPSRSHLWITCFSNHISSSHANMSLHLTCSLLFSNWCLSSLSCLSNWKPIKCTLQRD